MKLYTNSKALERTDQVLENLFNIDLEKLAVDQRIAGFLCIGNDLKVFGVFNPQYHRDDDGIITKVICNLRNESNRFFPVSVDPPAAFPALCSRDDIDESIRPKLTLTKKLLEGSDWEDTDKDLSLLLIPTMIPLMFGQTLPDTSVTDDDFVDKMSQLGPSAAVWAKTLKHYHDSQGQDDLDDAMKVYEKTMSDRKRGDYVHDPSIDHTGSDCVIISPIQDDNIYESEQSALRDFFVVPVSPAKDIRQSNTSSNTNTNTNEFSSQQQRAQQTQVYQQPSISLSDFSEVMKGLQFNIVNASDATNLSDANRGFAKLRMFNLCGEINWKNGEISDVSLPKPASTVSSIITAPPGSRAGCVQDLLYTLFKTKPTTNDEKFNPKFNMMSMNFFAKAFCQALIMGLYSTEPLTSELEPTNYINQLCFLPQNLKVKLNAAIQRDNQEKAEELNLIPEAQRAKRSSNIEIIGSIQDLNDIISTCANQMGIGRGLFDFTDKKSFMYQAAEEMIELLADRDFNDWNTNHSNEMPQLPWSCIAALQSLTTKLATFSRNMRNLSLLDPDHSVTTAPRDLDIDEVKKGVRTFARFIEKLKGHVEDGTIYTGVDASITPSNKNPEVLKYKAIMNELGSSSRQHAGDKSKVLSPPSSPSKGSRRQVAQSPDKKKRATSRGRGGGDRTTKARGTNASKEKKKKGFVRFAQGQNPTAFMRGISLKKKPCAFFMGQGFECTNSATKCLFEHYSNLAALDEDDQEKLLSEMDKDEGKSAWLCKATFERQNKLELVPEQYKYLLGDENGHPAKRT